MGVSYATYIGPYVRVPLVKTERVSTSYICSAKCGATGFTASTKFCSNCGQPVVKDEQRKLVAGPARAYDMPVPFEEQMWMPESAYDEATKKGYSTWLPNRGKHGVTLSRDHSEGQQEVNVSEETRTQALFRFDVEYSAFLAAVEQHFGVKPEVCYGALFYSH